jgi:hypothetical protein
VAVGAGGFWHAQVMCIRQKYHIVVMGQAAGDTLWW